MSCSRRFPPSSIALLASLALFAMVSWAQGAGAAKAAAGKAAAGAKAPPPARAPKAAAKPATEEVKVPPPEDPAVLAVLESKPKTPAELARAAQLLAGLNRPDLAKTFLRKLLDGKLSQQQWAALAKEAGLPMFTEMATQTELLPEARQVSDAILSATNRELQDRKRIDGLIKELQDPSEEVRAKALVGLAEARRAAVAALIGVLADATRSSEHPAVQAALAAMDGEATGPLLAAVERAKPELVAQGIQVLGQMNDREAAYYLLAPAVGDKSGAEVQAAARAALARLIGQVPSKQTAAGLLHERALLYFQGRQPVKADADGRAQRWRWDDDAKTCTVENCLADDAARSMAARLARDAFALAPADRQARLLYLAALLDDAAYANGLAKPVDVTKNPAAREAAALGVAAIEEALDYAMVNRHPAAAKVAVEILGAKGRASEVLRHGVEPSPLVRAVRHGDRRLRMAALEAIMRLWPAAPYAGSSYVPESLAFLASTSGARRALVGNPNAEGAREWAGSLAALGYEVDTATSGRELVRLALNSPDYEVALIDAAIDGPPLGYVLEELRRDGRSAALRVAVLARADHMTRAEHAARSDPLVLAFARPHTAEAFQWQMKQLETLAPREFVPFAERQEQAAHALSCLAVLAASSGTLYDMRRVEEGVLKAMASPKTATRAAVVLANLGTPESQLALVDLASRYGQPLEVRKVAVQALKISTEKHGVLLSADLVRRQYERYSQSGGQDLNTQQVLSTILDVLEAPGEKVKTKGTRQLPREPEKTRQPEKK